MVGITVFDPHTLNSLEKEHMNLGELHLTYPLLSKSPLSACPFSIWYSHFCYHFIYVLLLNDSGRQGWFWWCGDYDKGAWGKFPGKCAQLELGAARITQVQNICIHTHNHIKLFNPLSYSDWEVSANKGILCILSTLDWETWVGVASPSPILPTRTKTRIFERPAVT